MNKNDITPGTKVQLVRVDDYVLPTPIPGVVDRVLNDAVQVTHDAHDCDPSIPKGSLGFDFWPLDEIEIVQ